MPDVNRTAPEGKTHTQSMRFADDKWTKEKSQNWVKEHDGYTDGYEESENEHRWRQYNPDAGKFHYRSFDKGLPAGVHFIVGYPGAEAAQKKEKYNCECIKCGHMMESEKHCKEIKCPECGGEMRRKERPGPGSSKENITGENKMKQGIFMRTIAENSEEQIVDVIGVIGWEVWYPAMRDMLRAIPETIKRVIFEIYSPGGDVWEGNGIIQEIGELNKRIQTTARVQVAASMATLIAVACRDREIAKNGRWLIHNPWAAVQGDAEAMEKRAQELRDCEKEAAKFYAERTGCTQKEMFALMTEERWLTSEETLKYGFVQKINDPFNPVEYAEVRQEIEAAGKWPKALMENMEGNKANENIENEEGNKDGVKNISGAENISTIAPPETGNSADDQKSSEAFKAEYDLAKADGIAEGKSQALIEFSEQIKELKSKLAEAEKSASRHQSEKDKLIVQMETAQKLADKRAQSLREELDTATAKLKQFISGALTFSPAVETWQEAMSACGNDYAKAADKYPQLLKTYRDKELQKGRM